MDFHQSNWTDQEIGFAMGRGVPTFAIRFGTRPLWIYRPISGIQWNIEVAEDMAKELFDVYRKNKQTQVIMSDVVVGLFEDSGSFAEAKRLMEILRRDRALEYNLFTRIRKLG